MDLTRRAETALRDASRLHASGRGKLLFRTVHHPAAQELKEQGLSFETFDHLYDVAPDFASLYQQIAGLVTDTALALPVTYVVPGSVTTGEETARLILKVADERGIPTRIIPCADFVSPVLAAVKVAASTGYDVRDALSLHQLDTVDANGYPASSRLSTDRPLILFQVYDRDIASMAKLALMRDYPEDWQVALVHAAGTGEETVRWIQLHRLDREATDHLSSLYVPALPPELRPRDFSALTGIMARLRAADGCPWDREQTHESLKRYLVEEIYEVIDAIDSDDPEGLCEELGDALLQSVFHAQLAAEEGVFTIDDVVNGITTKLIRRHPHVFGDVDAADSAAVLVNWEKIKREEKADLSAVRRKSALDGVPVSMPALVRATEISRKAVKVGFDWPDLAGVMAKVSEELAELRAEVQRTTIDREAAGREIADLLFTLVQVARHLELDAEDLLRAMLKRFESRFRAMEGFVDAEGKVLSDCSQEELEGLWQRAKREENSGGSSH